MPSYWLVLSVLFTEGPLPVVYKNMAIFHSVLCLKSAPRESWRLQCILELGMDICNHCSSDKAPDPASLATVGPVRVICLPLVGLIRRVDELEEEER